MSNLHMNNTSSSSDTQHTATDTQSFISSCNNLIKHGNTMENVKLHTMINNHKKGLQHLTEGLEQMLQLSASESIPAANLLPQHENKEEESRGENL